MIPYTWLEEASERLAPHIQPTPLTYDPTQDLYLKWENQQITGSFKMRGALNKVLTLLPWERERGLVAASAGNHGQGVAVAARLVGARAVIFASEHAVPSKVEAMRALGAEVRLVAGGYGEAEAAGLAYAGEQNASWVSPYNDGQIIAGQGTLGLELLRQLPPISGMTFVTPVGGGGLIAGLGVALKEGLPTPPGGPGCCLVGVQSEASPFMHDLYHTGSQDASRELPSLADGLSGPVQVGSVTIPMVRRYLDDFVLVSEDEIRRAVALVWERYRERIEGSAAAALAAVLYGKIKARPAVVVISGGNIQPELHQEIISRAWEEPDHN